MSAPHRTSPITSNHPQSPTNHHQKARPITSNHPLFTSAPTYHSSLETRGAVQNMSVGRSVGWPDGRSVGRSISRPVGRSIDRSVAGSVGRSIDWSVGRSVGAPKRSKEQVGGTNTRQNLRGKYDTCTGGVSTQRWHDPNQKTFGNYFPALTLDPVREIIFLTKSVTPHFLSCS